MVYKEWKQHLLSGLVIALVTGALALGINLFITANNFRAKMEVEREFKNLRTLNFIVMVRDELKRIQQNIQKGNLDFKMENGHLVFPRVDWPHVVWSAGVGTGEFLNLDTELVTLISSLHDQTYWAHYLINSIRDNVLVSGQAEKTRELFREVFTEVGATLPERPSKEEVTQVSRLIRLYNEVKQNIATRLPDAVGTLELKIKHLQRELK